MTLSSTFVLLASASAFLANGYPIEFGGKIMSPEQFKLACKRATPDWIKTEKTAVKKAVAIEGRIAKKDAAGWTVEILDDQQKAAGSVLVTLGQLDAPRFREGRSVAVWGVVARGRTRTVSAYIVELLVPDISIEAEIVSEPERVITQGDIYVNVRAWSKSDKVYSSATFGISAYQQTEEGLLLVGYEELKYKFRAGPQPAIGHDDIDIPAQYRRLVVSPVLRTVVLDYSEE